MQNIHHLESSHTDAEAMRVRASAAPPKPPATKRKRNGAYYTPEAVARTLVRWAVRRPADLLLDPACGDGRFVAAHEHSVGVEKDAATAAQARARAPWAHIHQADFFGWAEQTSQRFDCVAGNPPFIRYQTFSGTTRAQALRLCEAQGVRFSRLASSWAPFLVVAASLLKPEGRLAFVVPAEIGHAPYAAPLLEYLLAHFSSVQVLAIRSKLFPELAEDCWLLYADGYGGTTTGFKFSAEECFRPTATPPATNVTTPAEEWRGEWNRRLRPYLLSRSARDGYRAVASAPFSLSLGEAASIGIGYVTGANDFFHLRPSEAEYWRIPATLLCPTVRNSSYLPTGPLTADVVEEWKRRDQAMLLLRLARTAEKDLPTGAVRYLNSERGVRAREAYKCRIRKPWYSVPHVRFPDFFLTYMTSYKPNLVRNRARVTGTNALHGVHIHDSRHVAQILAAWDSPFATLSAEIEGHPLGGGVLKLEPGEAAKIVLPRGRVQPAFPDEDVWDAITILRKWRHHAVR